MSCRRDEWDSLRTALSDEGRGCILAIVGAPQLAEDYAEMLFKEPPLSERPHAIIHFDSRFVSPLQLLEEIRKTTRQWPHEKGTVFLIGTAPAGALERIKFWKDANYVREAFDGILAHCVFMIGPDEYGLFLNEADHFADWCMLRVDLRPTETATGRFIERMEPQTAPSANPIEIRKTLDNYKQLLEHDKAMGIGEAVLAERYHLPMFRMALDAMDINRASDIFGRIREDAIPENQQIQWLRNKAKLLHSKGDYLSAKLALENAVESAKKQGNRIEESEALSDLSTVLFSLSEFKRIVEIEHKALSIDLEVFGNGHPRVALHYNNLGAAWSGLGDLRKAIDYYERALQIDLAVFGDNHPNVARGYNNLGEAWRGLGEPRKAIDYYERALQIDLAVFGDRHPKVAIRYNNLGRAWYSLGEPRKAIDYYERALSIDLAVLGDRHPDTAIDYNNLGGAWKDLGEPRKALDYFRRALDICTAVYGPDHPSTKTVYRNMNAVSGGS